MIFDLYETEVYHRLLWMELAETGEKQKWTAKFWETHKIKSITGSCFPCIWAEQQSLPCSRCPVIWGDVDCDMPKSPYRKWYYAETIEERKKYAKMVLNCKWRDEL